MSLRFEGRRAQRRVRLIELALSHALVASNETPEIGMEIGVIIALQDRHIEFELPAVVTWHNGGELALSFEYLTLRQNYGLVLAIELERQATRLKEKLAHTG